MLNVFLKNLRFPSKHNAYFLSELEFDFLTKVTWLCVTIRRLGVAQFLPECQLVFPFSPRTFIPKLVAHFHPEFLAQFVPELVAQFDPE